MVRIERSPEGARAINGALKENALVGGLRPDLGQTDVCILNTHKWSHWSQCPICEHR